MTQGPYANEAAGAYHQVAIENCRAETWTRRPFFRCAIMQITMQIYANSRSRWKLVHNQTADYELITNVWKWPCVNYQRRAASALVSFIHSILLLLLLLLFCCLSFCLYILLLLLLHLLVVYLVCNRRAGSHQCRPQFRPEWPFPPPLNSSHFSFFFLFLFEKYFFDFFFTIFKFDSSDFIQSVPQFRTESIAGFRLPFCNFYEKKKRFNLEPKKKNDWNWNLQFDCECFIFIRLRNSGRNFRSWISTGF